MTRHEWGTVHPWLSFGLLGLLALHIILAWPQLVCRFRLWVKETILRWVMGLGLIALMVGLLAWPFTVEPDFKARGNAGQLT